MATAAAQVKDDAKLKKKLELISAEGFSPVSGLGTPVMMLLMFPNEVTVFVLMLLANIVMTPVNAILSARERFDRHTEDEEWADNAEVKSAATTACRFFVLIQLGVVALIMVKFSFMGLFPSASTDWIHVPPVPFDSAVITAPM